MKQSVSPLRVVSLVGLLSLSSLLAGCHPGQRRHFGPASGEGVRAIWVTRWDYKSAGDIAKVMRNCQGAGFNTVLFQVRGNGTAFYRSRIEPWADELGGRDPGFDPLAIASREAHGRGLALHAWVNVMPGWRGDNPPANRRQLYWRRPEWFWRDAAGRRQPLGWYNSLNPCYSEVRQYLVSVMREIVGRYAIEGLHLDYIRFPNEWHKSYSPRLDVPDYPRDPRTLALFRRATGATPERAPDKWNAWRTAQVTQLLRDIRSMMRRVKPTVKLTAAVGASMDEAKRRHFQDAQRWIAEGLLDAVFPMNYESSLPAFGKTLQAWAAVRRRLPVITGVMFDRREAGTVMAQLDRLRTTGAPFAAFAYNSLFERLDPAGRPIRDDQSASRAALRKSIIPYLRRQTVRRT